ncbi:MAG: hypothetical protein EA352_12015 [Gemmatimonadales bacterium]|nr:MAG: hypothetical protein EA352_12015 [Gemmatimonadales bacterium]
MAGGLVPALAAALVLGLALVPALVPAPAQAQQSQFGDPIPQEGQQNPVFGPDTDPRVGLAAGWKDAEEAAWNMRLLSSTARPDGFRNPDAPGDRRFSNTDLAFQGDLVFVGNYHGFTVWDISDPAAPTLRTAVACAGGQGDISVYGNLVFMSAQETRARLDCGDEGVEEPVSEERFRGVRIFDVSNLDDPQQVAAVQTCRGSHTHTVVTEPGNDEMIWVYNSGTSAPRPAEEMAGCNPERDPEDPTTSFWSIDVIEVPLSAPENARIVDSPRVFADRQTGDIDGLWQQGDHGDGTQQTRATDRCHDITAYPEIGLAAGACSGNGILLDISDPAAPVRIHEVSDPNFAFWHSATFSNDGSTIIFTDEWGGGTQPRCRAEDDLRWGANALFTVRNGRMEFAGYYKLPAPQTELENCVAHNGSLLPVPGRDIKVQSWYQGGVSVFDFTDPANPFEIAFFDRGPVDGEEMLSAGYWSTYWYNGLVVGSEISRGMDLLELEPSEFLSENEIAAANLVHFDEFNPQHQPRYGWPPAYVVARAYLDQVIRHEALPAARTDEVAAELDRLESLPEGAEQRSGLQELATTLWGHARAVDEGRLEGDAERIRTLGGAVLDLAADR